MNTERHIGRVGALAVALGVGIGLSSSVAIAAADSSDDDSGLPSTATPDSARSHSRLTTQINGAGRESAPARAAAAQRGLHGSDRTPQALRRSIDSVPARAATDDRLDSATSFEITVTRVEGTPATAASVISVGEVSVGLPTNSELETATAAPVMTAVADVPAIELTGVASSTNSPMEPLEASIAFGVLAWTRKEFELVSASVSAIASSEAPESKFLDSVTAPALSRVPSPAAATATGSDVAAAVVQASPPSMDEIFQYTLFNKAPIVNPTQQSSGGIITGNLNASSPMGAVLTYGVTQTPTRGTVTVDADGSYVYTPDVDLARTGGIDSFTVTVDGGSAYRLTGIAGIIQGLVHTVAQLFGLSEPDTTRAVVNITVGANNQAPTAKATVSAPNVNTGAVTVKITATDTEADVLTYSAPSNTDKGTITNAGDGTFTYTPTAAARHVASSTSATAADKQDAFSVTVSDGYGGTVTVPVTVTVSPANSAPTAKATVSNPDASAKVTVTVVGTDVDADGLSYSAPTSTAKGTITNAGGGTFIYTPTAAARHAASATSATATTKQDTFNVTVGDGFGGTVTVPITVAITPTNSAPTAKATVSSPNSSTAKVTVTVTGTDPDSDKLTFSAPSSTSKGTITNGGNGTFTYTPTAAARQKAGASGAAAADKQDTFTVTVTDGYGGTTTVAVKVTVLGSAQTTSDKTAAFVAAFQGKVWGAASYGTKAYTSKNSLTNDTKSPYYTPDMVGECVSLVTQFLKYAYNITPGAWGNADEWAKGGKGGQQMEAKGFKWYTDKNFKNGDILVFSSVHIGIYYNGKLFDSNNTAGGRGADGIGGWAARHAGFGEINVIPGYVGYWRK